MSLYSLMLPFCLQESPCISHEDYNDLIATLTEFIVTKTVGVEDVYRKVLLLFSGFFLTIWKDTHFRIICVCR